MSAAHSTDPNPLQPQLSTHTMALNALDSLNPTAPTAQKHPFSLKKKGDAEDAGPEFGQMLGAMMPPAPVPGVGKADAGLSPEGEASAESGQQMAISGVMPSDLPTLALTTTPNLTALVLSPNMTAITPSQAAPDAGSLVAFARSQGLDADVAAWLVSAGQGSPSPASAALALPGQTAMAGASADMAAPSAAALNPDATGNTPASEAQALANAALTISVLASPGPLQARAAVAPLPTENTSAPVQLMPTLTPAAWLAPRVAQSGKTNTTAPAQPPAGDRQAPAHTSELDLTLIFAPGKDALPALKTTEAASTPAAWVMAGLANPLAQSATLIAAASLGKLPADALDRDEGLPPTEGLNSFSADRGPAKPADLSATAASSAGKSTEFTLSVADRQEQHQAQAEKMGQAIGQRMLSEMEKGHWHLKMMLRPANLGHIEVEMRLRNGELDASFTASQAMTRDLLQDGMPKLRDTLTQMGMDVANMNVGGGSSQKNGGEPTPGRASGLPASAQNDHPEEQSMKITQHVTKSGQDGLDVLV